LASRSRATFVKRQKESARQEKQQSKQERKLQRRLEKHESPLSPKSSESGRSTEIASDSVALSNTTMNSSGTETIERELQ
jgi:hypothetical protein